MTAPTVDALVEDRRAAIVESGWNHGFRFVQPRNLAFWVYLLIVGFGLGTFVRSVTATTAVLGGALLLAAVLFTLYGALFWWFTAHIDRYAHQSRRLMIVGFCWGAFGATQVLAVAGNNALLSLWGKGFGQAWSLSWGAGLTAPFIEETAKGVGLLLLIALAPRLVRSAFDGFILGAFIGLGFQIVEDLVYALNSASAEFGVDPVGNELPTIAIRMLFGVASHILYSAIFCTGLVYAIGRPAQPRRLGLGLVLMATAMVLHGVWDDLGALVAPLPSGAIVVAWLVVIALALVAVTRTFAIAVRPERAFVARVLAPEVAGGVVTDEEAATLSGDGKARRRYRKAAKGAERGRRRVRLVAAHDLAEELARAGGADSDRVLFARQEVARLRTP